MVDENPGVVSRWVDPLLRVAYRGAYGLALAYWFVRRPESSGTFVGVWHGGKVLLLQNSYKRRFSLPGGGQDPGESPEETGARELREEVGLHASPQALRKVFERLGREEFKRDHCHFLELDLEAEPALSIDNREVVWAAFIDLDTALQLPLVGLVRAYLEDAARRRRPGAQRDRP